MENETNRGQEQDPNVSRAPDFRTQFGRTVAAVWKREGEDGRMNFSVSLTRSYKDSKTDQWVRTTMLDPDDLLTGALALQEAFRWVEHERHGSRESSLKDLSTPARAANS
jgi:hypothetical protein